LELCSQFRFSMRNLFPKSSLSFIIAVILAPALLGIFSLHASGQVSQGMSRAEQEAEQQVSLSPEKIIEVLRNEPGLLLQLKKLLVRQAFEQGRILNASDLSDDALFRLLWEDENARVLATQEIEDREYIRAKPTHEEIERELAAQRGLSRASLPEPVAGPAAPETSKSIDGLQEGAYWSKREQDWQNNTHPRDRRAEPFIPAEPDPSSPERPEPPQRQLNQAGLQPTPDGYTDMEARSRANPALTNSAFTNSAPTVADFASPGYGNTDFAVPGSALPSENSFAPSYFGTGNEASQQTSNRNYLSNAPAGGTASSAGSYRGGPENNFVESRLENSATKPVPQDFNHSIRNGDNQPIIRHQPNPYANIPSLYDLYTQVSRRSPTAERFGMEIFSNGTGNLDNLPMDLPVGPEYVLGPGDGLNIELWGGVAQRLQRVIDREGRVALPEVGSIPVSGRPLGEAQRIVQSVLRTQFHDVEADVSLARIRSVRVYVVGDVVRPGAYDISSLSSPLNALYAAGGPTARGSLRHLRQYRGKTLVQTIDIYDLLLHGIHTEIARIESGDTILVPSWARKSRCRGWFAVPQFMNSEKNAALPKF